MSKYGKQVVCFATCLWHCPSVAISKRWWRWFPWEPLEREGHLSLANRLLWPGHCCIQRWLLWSESERKIERRVDSIGEDRQSQWHGIENAVCVCDLNESLSWWEPSQDTVNDSICYYHCWDDCRLYFTQLDRIGWVKNKDEKFTFLLTCNLQIASCSNYRYKLRASPKPKISSKRVNFKSTILPIFFKYCNSTMRSMM